MPTRTGYKPGVPCWVDLSSTDLTASVGFYEELFGWRAEFDPSPDSGGYGRFRQGGKLVAGIGPTFGEGVPSVWNTYIATDDALSVAEKVEQAGGRVTIGPVQVFDQGSMAVFQDPAGGSFMVWQPGRHRGAELADEPVALCWSELDSRDPEGSKAFYPAVFGWGSRGAGDAAGVDYTEWMVDGRAVAGMLPIGDRFPSESGTRWLAFFAVRDCDGTVTLAEQRGGKVLRPAQDLPMGRHAVLADPQGAAFAVIALKPAQ
jgi:predicted enzyme related to lactoylglutathione lyase